MKKLGPFKDRRIKPGKTGRDHCEAALGVDYSGSAPLILMCKKPTAWIYFGTREPTCRLGMALCEECYEIITKQKEPV